MSSQGTMAQSDETGILLGEVQFSDPPRGGYTYRLVEPATQWERGIRVRVPFGQIRRIGYLTRLFRGPDAANYRDVISPVDLQSLIPEDVLDLTGWLADYYMCSWGEALAAAMPHGLQANSKVRFRLTEAARAELWIADEPGPTGNLFRALQATPLSAAQAKRRFPDGERLLTQFRRRGWIEAVEVAPRASAGRWIRIYRWNGSIEYDAARVALPGRAVKLRMVLDALQGHNGLIDQVMLAGIQGGLTMTMAALQRRGWVAVDRVPRDDSSALQMGMAETATAEPELSQMQRAVAGQICAAIDSGGYHPFLLYGVTGSGKTLVYLEAIEQALKSGKGAIVLVPEISLTPQITGRIRRRFGSVVAVTHSGLADTERRWVWQAARTGEIRVVIGPRSAVFAPLSRLGLVVVDEEHDDSYKQSDPAPRYNGRDVALYRASRAGATVILGSATPDVVSYQNARDGRYKLLELTERHGGVTRPDIYLAKWGMGGERSVFGSRMLTRLTECLERQEQAILLVNRRGFSTCIRCPDCGDVVRCPNCDITLRYHRVGSKLECHYCGYVTTVVDACPKCGGQRLRYSGLGTQKVQRELELRFPSARLARLDLDTTRTRGSQQEVLNRFAKREFDILLGTQMVAKGHDFPGVRLVGILTADSEWLLPDFRAEERAFRLLLQAAGRSGRAGGGDVIVQSLEPSHSLLKWVMAQDYSMMFRSEMAARMPLQYPPFSRLIAIELRGKDRSAVQSAARELRERLKPALKASVLLGPAPPPIERLESQFRRRFLVKLPPRMTAAASRDRQAVRQCVDEFGRASSRQGVKLALDVDPVDM